MHGPRHVAWAASHRTRSGSSRREGDPARGMDCWTWRAPLVCPPSADRSADRPCLRVRRGGRSTSSLRSRRTRRPGRRPVHHAARSPRARAAAGEPASRRTAHSDREQLRRPPSRRTPARWTSRWTAGPETPVPAPRWRWRPRRGRCVARWSRWRCATSSAARRMERRRASPWRA